MKYILHKLTATNTQITLEFASHSALMCHLMRMNSTERGASIVAVFISPL